MGNVSTLPYQKLVWLLPAVLTIHELEEWNIKEWNTANFIGTPDTPDSAVRVLLVLVSIAGFLVTAIACAFSSSTKTAYITLTFFILVAFNNSLQHLFWQLYWGAYAPGVLAAAFLNVPAILLLSWHALKNRLVSPLYIAILYTTAVPALYLTFRQGRQFPEVMAKGHEFGVNIINLF